MPAGNREVRFLLARGWRLEQIARGSRFALPVGSRTTLARRRADAERHAGDDYRIHLWTGPTPERWLADQAMPEHADEHRCADRRARGARRTRGTRIGCATTTPCTPAGPRLILTAAAEHVATGTLAAFTQLGVPADVTRPVTQEDTLVLREHRGHRLGMLLKVANLQYLEEVAPGHPCVLTWNAEENRAMLDVNEAVGFVPIGYEGAWRKDL